MEAIIIALMIIRVLNVLLSEKKPSKIIEAMDYAEEPVEFLFQRIWSKGTTTFHRSFRVIVDDTVIYRGVVKVYPEREENRWEVKCSALTEYDKEWVEREFRKYYCN